jgi:pyruvate,orthophosphate dikinase
MMIQPSQLVQLLHTHIDPKAKVEPIAKGLPASPGAAVGEVVFDVDEAARRGSSGEDVILVRLETTPEDIHGTVGAKGVLTSRGGMTCHAAVVARGMGKPAVVGCEEVKIDLEHERFRVKDKVVKKGEAITIDGTTGSVILGKVPMVEPELSWELKKLLAWADKVRYLKVRANADTPEGASRARSFGAEGIGLCRTERMFNAPDRLPIVQEMILAEGEDRKKTLERLLPLQKGDFKKIFRAMEGLPVTIRLLDLPLHEFLPKLEELLIEVTRMSTKGEMSETFSQKDRVLKEVIALNEHNPMLGHRGCRLSIRYPEIYEMQAKAIFEAATELTKEGVHVDLEIMLPLVGLATELAFLRKVIEKTAEKILDESGVKLKYLIGTMIEVPRAALTADEIAKYAEFFSFGTNDLTQTVFGYSRDDAEAKFLHDYLEKKILEVNPFEVIDRNGVGKIMKIATELGRKTRGDLKIGICGEHGGDPSSIEFCHQLKLDYVSCSPFRVPVARLAAAQAKIRQNLEAQGQKQDFLP